MIQTEQSTETSAPLQTVWDYVVEFERWAALMPGFRSCESLGPDDSHWILKVGVGGMVRTVNVHVHVERWSAPEAVDFRFHLESDPVEGNGSYQGRALPSGGTALSLSVEVRGSGPLAPMWEAMSRPLLPQMVRGFAEKLVGEIEASVAVAADAAPAVERRSGVLARLWTVIASLLGKKDAVSAD